MRLTRGYKIAAVAALVTGVAAWEYMLQRNDVVTATGLEQTGSGQNAQDTMCKAQFDRVTVATPQFQNYINYMKQLPGGKKAARSGHVEFSNENGHCKAALSAATMTWDMDGVRKAIEERTAIPSATMTFNR